MSVNRHWQSVLFLTKSHEAMKITQCICLYRILYLVHVSSCKELGRLCFYKIFVFWWWSSLLSTQKHNFNFPRQQELTYGRDIQLGSECKFTSWPDQDNILKISISLKTLDSKWNSTLQTQEKGAVTSIILTHRLNCFFKLFKEKNKKNNNTHKWKTIVTSKDILYIQMCIIDFFRHRPFWKNGDHLSCCILRISFTIICNENMLK